MYDSRGTYFSVEDHDFREGIKIPNPHTILMWRTKDDTLLETLKISEKSRTTWIMVRSWVLRLYLKYGTLTVNRLFRHYLGTQKLSLMFDLWFTRFRHILTYNDPWLLPAFLILPRSSFRSPRSPSSATESTRATSPTTVSKYTFLGHSFVGVLGRLPHLLLHSITVSVEVRSPNAPGEVVPRVGRKLTRVSNLR